MPKLGKKHYPYSKAGIKAYKKAVGRTANKKLGRKSKKK